MLRHLTFWIGEHGQIYIIQLLAICTISPVYLSSSEQLHLDVTFARVMHRKFQINQRNLA